MLDYSMFNKFRFLTDDTKDLTELMEDIEFAKADYALETTKTRLEKAKKKREEIDNLTYEEDLIIGNVIALIKEDIAQSYYNIFRYFNIGDLMWKAWKYSAFKNQNRLKELEEEHAKDPKNCYSLKDYEDAFNFVVSTVKLNLIPEKYRAESNLIEIVDWCNSTAYEFNFRYEEVEYSVCIPMFNNANNENYLEILSGYALRFKESNYSIGLVFSVINPKEYMSKLEQWLNKKVGMVVVDYNKLYENGEVAKDESKD